ncbi:MAG: DUF3168 domain-containing protein [Pirellulales bacterium]|nr:DUF3168 domain-containing protein [Pirellulales bacterium]
MSSEAAIHAHWTNDPALTALLPAERFVTGLGQSELAMPYATLTRESTRPKLRTSDRTIDESEFRFDIWSINLDEAKQVAAAVSARFDRRSFATDGSTDDCTVIRMRLTRYEEQQEPDNSIWRVTLGFVAITARAIGA